MRLGGKSQVQWGTGGSGTIGGGGIDGEGRGRTNPVGAKAGKEGRDIPRVRERESFEGSFVVKGKSEKFGGDRVGFGVIEEREWRLSSQSLCDGGI